MALATRVSSTGPARQARFDPRYRGLGLRRGTGIAGPIARGRAWQVFRGTGLDGWPDGVCAPLRAGRGIHSQNSQKSPSVVGGPFRPCFPGRNAGPARGMPSPGRFAIFAEFAAMTTGAEFCESPPNFAIGGRSRVGRFGKAIGTGFSRLVYGLRTIIANFANRSRTFVGRSPPSERPVRPLAYRARRTSALPTPAGTPSGSTRKSLYDGPPAHISNPSISTFNECSGPSRMRSSILRCRASSGGFASSGGRTSGVSAVRHWIFSMRMTVSGWSGSDGSEVDPGVARRPRHRPKRNNSATGVPLSFRGHSPSSGTPPRTPSRARPTTGREDSRPHRRSRMPRDGCARSLPASNPLRRSCKP